MTDNRNTILAVILSGLVLIAWQYFYNVPQMEKQRQQTQKQAELAKPSPQTRPRDGARQHRAATRRRADNDHARGHGADRRRPGRQPRRRDRSDPAHQDRDPARFRQHLAEGRAHRRHRADPVPRHRRPEISGHRAVLALADRAPLLRRIRLGAGDRLDDPDARPEHDVAAGGLRHAVADRTR